VLSKNHSRRADQSCHDENQAEPPHGIERPFERIGDECAGKTADGRRVGRDFPPDIDDGADDLNGKRRQENAADDVRNVDGVHRVVAREIADDRDDVGHHSPLFRTDFVGMPALGEAVEADEQRRQENREDIRLQEHQQFELPRHHLQIAEHKQCHQSHQRKVERRENHAHGSRGYHQLLFVQYFFLHTYDPKSRFSSAKLQRSEQNTNGKPIFLFILESTLLIIIFLIFNGHPFPFLYFVGV